MWPRDGRRSARSARRTPGPGDVVVRALHSALSRGTERLVFTGARPGKRIRAHARPFMGGAFPFPVKYGYAMVGPGRGRPGAAARPHRLRAASAPDRVRASGRRGHRRAGHAFRPAAPCSPPIWRPRSTRSGMPRRARAIASPWSAAGVVGLLIGMAVRGASRRRGDAGRYRPAAGARRRSRPRLRRARGRAARLRPRVPCERERRRPRDRAAARRATRQPCWS